MQKLLIITGVAGALLLAGCTDAASSKREAGNWVNEVELIKLDVPGMPPEMKDGMTQMMASAANTNFCLTPEEAAKSDLDSLLDSSGGGGGQCTWTKKDVNGANVDVVGSCLQNGQKADLAMKGTLESKRSDITITTKAQLPDGKQMEMVMRVKSKHTGACTAESKPPVPAAG